MWAKFMRAKYLNCEQVLVKATASPLWRDLVQHYDTVRDLSRWIVGSRQRRFWLDNWTGEILQGPLPVDGNLFIAHGLEIISDLWQFIPTRLQNQIVTHVLTPTKPDTLVFTPSPHGKFCIKEYIETPATMV